MAKDKSEKRKNVASEPTAEVEDVDMVDVQVRSTVTRNSTHAYTNSAQNERKTKKNKEEISMPLEDLSPIAHPLAQKKLLKKLHKTIKKGQIYLLASQAVRSNRSTASKAREVKRGVKEVVKGIRKGEKGYAFVYVLSSCCTQNDIHRLLVLAADITPIDIISHLPILSEEAQIPYVFVTSKEELGNASATKRPTSCVMICPNQKKSGKRKEGEVASKDDDYRELYEECCRAVEKLDHKIVV